MSDIEFNCLSCNQSLSVDESGAGMEVQCPGCGQSVTVPQASQPTQKPRLALKKSCPSCGNAVQYDDVICVNCGTNLKTGANLQTAVGRNKQQPVSQSGSQSLRQFKYEAMDQNGKDFTGIVKAETQADAHGKIRGLGLFPTSINQVGIKSGGQNTVQETRQPQKEEPVVEKSSSGGGTIAGIIAFIVLSLLFNSKMRHDFFGLFKSNPATQSAPVTPATPSYTPSATPSYDQTRESRINELVRQGYDRAKATEAVDLVGTRFDK